VTFSIKIRHGGTPGPARVPVEGIFRQINLACPLPQLLSSTFYL
jgi:hypothetical protein